MVLSISSPASPPVVRYGNLCFHPHRSLQRFTDLVLRHDVVRVKKPARIVSNRGQVSRNDGLNTRERGKKTIVGVV